MDVSYIDCSPFVRGLFTPALEAIVPGMVIHLEDPRSEAELISRMAGAMVVLNGHTAMPAAVLRQCPGLRSIVFLGTGASSYIDMAAAASLGIAVRTVPGYGDRAVAEHAMALMLAAARRVTSMDRALRSGHWEPEDGIELEGKRLGVIGAGGIGRCFMRLAAGFGMEVVAWNRSEPAVPLGFPRLELADVLATSDVVSLHLALTPQTRGFLGAVQFAAMKPGAILVNTARGGLVEEAALMSALDGGRLRHAALDVFDEEPMRPDHPLTRRADVTLTAHAGYKTPEATRRLLRLSLEHAARDRLTFAAA